MDSGTRRDNFKRLIERRFDHSHKDAAQEIGVTPGRITQLLDPAEAFGERVARKIEDKLRLPPRWLDTVAIDGAAAPTVKESLTPQPPTPAEVVSQLAAVLRTVPRAQRAGVAGALAALARGPDSNDLAADVLDALASTAPAGVQDLPGAAAA